MNKALSILLALSLGAASAQSSARNAQTQGVVVTGSTIDPTPPVTTGGTTATVTYTPEQLIGDRYAEATAGSTDQFLKGICPDQGFSALMPGEFQTIISSFKPDFSIDGLKSMVDGMCRIKATHNEVLRVLNQNDWAATGRLAVDTLLGQAGISKEQSGPVLDEVFKAIQSGTVDTMGAINRIAAGYTSNLLKDKYELSPGTDLMVDENGASIDPEIPGIMTASGKMDLSPMDEAIFDGGVMSALDNGRDAMNGLGSVFSRQEADVQSMEASARRMQGIVQAAYTVLGDDSKIGAIEERVQASQQATSLREQMIAQVQATTDQTRLIAENNVSILGQLVENARVNSNTNQLLANQAQRMYNDELAKTEKAIQAYKAEVERDVRKYQADQEMAQLLNLQYHKSMLGDGMLNFTWDDVTGKSRQGAQP